MGPHAPTDGSSTWLACTPEWWRQPAAATPSTAQTAAACPCKVSTSMSLIPCRHTADTVTKQHGAIQLYSIVTNTYKLQQSSVVNAQ